MQDRMEIVAVNSGYYNTKVKTSTEEFLFPTKVREGIINSNVKTLKINGQEFEIGEGGKNISDSKHNNLTHRMCTLYAIAVSCNSGDNIHLVTSLPINQFKDSIYRELYRFAFTKNPEYVVYADGVEKKFTIKKTTVYMEGASAILPYASYFKNKVVGVIDIGGYNINCAVFNNQKLETETSFSTDTGMYHLERNIADTLGQYGYGYIKDYEVLSLFKSDELIIKDIVAKESNLLLNDLKEKLVEKGWNLKTLQLFSTGGGSLSLSDYLKDKFDKIVVNDTGLYDNVRGLYKVGELSAKMYQHY